MSSSVKRLNRCGRMLAQGLRPTSPIRLRVPKRPLLPELSSGEAWMHGLRFRRRGSAAPRSHRVIEVLAEGGPLALGDLEMLVRLAHGTAGVVLWSTRGPTPFRSRSILKP